MSNAISIQGIFTIVGDNAYETNPISLTYNSTQTGSNIADVQTLTVISGSWQPLATSSLVNGVAYAHFRNSSTGSIKLACSSAGAGLNPVILPGGWCLITFGSGSIPQFFAQSMTANSSSVLRYALAEK